MTIPASVFQSLNAAFIILLGTSVAGYWLKTSKNKEASSLFKMAVGTMIMGTGFFFMSAASAEFDTNGSSAMYWLVLLTYSYHWRTMPSLLHSLSQNLHQ